MENYQNGQLNKMPSLQDVMEKQSQAQYGPGSITGLAASGHLQQLAQETVTSMLREILMRLGRIEQKL